MLHIHNLFLHVFTSSICPHFNIFYLSILSSFDPSSSSSLIYFFFYFFSKPTALSPHPLVIVLCLHVFGDVFHSVHCLLQVCIPLNSQTLPVLREPTAPIWQVARLPAKRVRQVLVHVERFGVLWDPTESDVGVLPLVCAGLGVAFPGVSLVGVLPAEFVADVGGAWTPHEEEGGQPD